MENLDGTIIATAAPAMAPTSASRPSTSMSRSLPTSSPRCRDPGQRLAHRPVRRPADSAVAIAVFTVASVLCAVSGSLAMLVACGSLQGVGGAMMVPVGRLVVLRATAKRICSTPSPTSPGRRCSLRYRPGPGWLDRVSRQLAMDLLDQRPARDVVRSSSPADRARPTAPSVRTGWTGSGSLLCGRISVVPAGRHRARRRLGSSAGAAWHASQSRRRSGSAVVSAAGGCGGPRTRCCGSDALRVPSFRVGNIGGVGYRVVISAVPFLLPLMFQVGFGWSPVRAGDGAVAVRRQLRHQTGDQPADPAIRVPRRTDRQRRRPGRRLRR